MAGLNSGAKCQSLLTDLVEMILKELFQIKEPIPVAENVIYR